MNVFCCVIPTSVFKWCSRAVITNIVILVLIVSLSSWPMPLPWSHWGTTDDFATSFFHFSMFSKCCLLGLGELQACPFSDVVFPPLPLSALSSSPFHCALHLHSKSSKEEYKLWKWGAAARYYTSHTKTMLPTRKSVPRFSRQSDHTKTWTS